MRYVLLNYLIISLSYISISLFFFSYLISKLITDIYFVSYVRSLYMNNLTNEQNCLNRNCSFLIGNINAYHNIINETSNLVERKMLLFALLYTSFSFAKNQCLIYSYHKFSNIFFHIRNRARFIMTFESTSW